MKQSLFKGHDIFARIKEDSLECLMDIRTENDKKALRMIALLLRAMCVDNVQSARDIVHESEEMGLPVTFLLENILQHPHKVKCEVFHAFRKAVGKNIWPFMQRMPSDGSFKDWALYREEDVQRAPTLMAMVLYSDSNKERVRWSGITEIVDSAIHEGWNPAVSLQAGLNKDLKISFTGIKICLPSAQWTPLALVSASQNELLWDRLMDDHRVSSDQDSLDQSMWILMRRVSNLNIPYPRLVDNLIKLLACGANPNRVFETPSLLDDGTGTKTTAGQLLTHHIVSQGQEESTVRLWRALAPALLPESWPPPHEMEGDDFQLAIRRLSSLAFDVNVEDFRERREALSFLTRTPRPLTSKDILARALNHLLASLPIVPGKEGTAKELQKPKERDSSEMRFCVGVACSEGAPAWLWQWVCDHTATPLTLNEAKESFRRFLDSKQGDIRDCDAWSLAMTSQDAKAWNGFMNEVVNLSPRLKWGFGSKKSFDGLSAQEKASIQMMLTTLSPQIPSPSKPRM